MVSRVGGLFLEILMRLEIEMKEKNSVFDTVCAHDFNQFIDEQNNIQKRKIAFSLLKNPSQIKHIIRLVKNHRFAAKHLSGYLFLLFGKR